ncbi:MAG: histidine kinase [Saprospiraceae bacterium]|nr:histidine kinase [Lewinella sp.]
MNFSRRSIWGLVSIAVILFTFSNVAGILGQDELSAKNKILLSVIILVYFSLHWATVIWLSMHWQKRYPENEQDRIRLTKTYTFSALVLVVTMMLIDCLQNLLIKNEFKITPYEALFDVFQGMGIAILIVSLTEAFYQYEKNRQSEKEKAELVRVNLLAQYNHLKQQVSPHFLFNSLNTLSSLISIDPIRAERFVSELSLVYRYLLQNSEDKMVELGKELLFLNSYIHLMKTRFGSGLSVDIDVPAIWHTYLIPPLSLQLLVENAIKHNVVSPDQPLHIEIKITEDQNIQIKNNLQGKQLSLPSEKVGLVNIMEKYRLLGQAEVVVLKTDTEFSVSLPLIKYQGHGSTDR